MRRTLILAAGFALIAGSAFGQAMGDRDTDYGRAGHQDWRHGDRDGHGRWDRDRRGGGDRAARGRDEDEDDDHPPMRSREGARFRFQSGNTHFSVRCDGRETMRACVEAALTVLDRARSLPPSPAAPPGESPQAPPR